MLRKTCMAVILVFGGATVTAAVSPQAAVKIRHDGMKSIGKTFKGINDDLRSGSPDIAKIAGKADQLKRLAPNVAKWVPRGSGPEAGVKTDALPAIWTKPDDYQAKATSLVQATANLARVSRSNDLAAVRAQVKVVGGTCKACHDQFKKPED